MSPDLAGATDAEWRQGITPTAATRKRGTRKI